MAETDTSPLILVGDKVRMTHDPHLVGWVMEKSVSHNEPGQITYTV
jgi:hypothetical protein